MGHDRTRLFFGKADHLSVGILSPDGTTIAHYCLLNAVYIINNYLTISVDSNGNCTIVPS